MKRIGLFILSGLLLLPVMSVAATSGEMKPSLLLDHIKVIKAGERDGDELYFDVSVYRAKHATQYFRVPERPNHEPSQIIDRRSHIKLWSEPLKVDETVTVVVSLVDADMSGVNPDDLIGLVRVTLKNEEGVLRTVWSKPNHSTGSKTVTGHHAEPQAFELSGDNGDYVVYLSLVK